MSEIKYVLLILLLATACKQESVEIEDHSEHHTNETNAVAKSMDLMLSESQVLLANIKTRKVSFQPVSQRKVINARIAANTELSNAISSRVAGRIERLYKKETGRSVKAGEPLYEIYSEGLLTLQQEYLLALQQSGSNQLYKSFEESARKKLLLYGLTQTQLDQLVKTGNVKSTITFVAPASGVIQSVDVAEGQYVSEGSKLFTLVNLNKLWVEAELYADEAGLINTGDALLVKATGKAPVNAVVDFVSPEFKTGTQIWTLRATITNAGNFRPGEMVQVTVAKEAAHTLVLPVQAVIHNQDGTHVYIETEKNTFQPRVVKTGIETSTEVQITEGLAEGETVVVSGAYLLYSEYILKHGVNPAHQH